METLVFRIPSLGSNMPWSNIECPFHCFLNPFIEIRVYRLRPYYKSIYQLF
ncbi:hypothetical protein FD34_GL000606 [Limosilactobacillus pontis DSM 8475]|uniref:Uncharacterized protein n=1 Tax=Limosilactobacillus pontis DSM 8475 TaxID=1423794 RepID=A0A922THZ9_9LACO|nr:hypothetical protein FD34_GL000606 [Limosilactobacillus pontis DSM 8475]